MSCEKKHKGGRNELIATVWLLNQGYEVFRNVSQHGEIDLIARRGDEIVFFDVKSGERRKDGSPVGSLLKASQVALGVKPLYVFDDGGCFADWSPVSRDVRGATERTCPRCSSQFRPAVNLQRFCSKKCQVSNYYQNVCKPSGAMECTGL